VADFQAAFRAFGTLLVPTKYSTNVRAVGLIKDEGRILYLRTENEVARSSCSEVVA